MAPPGANESVFFDSVIFMVNITYLTLYIKGKNENNNQKHRRECAFGNESRF